MATRTAKAQWNGNLEQGDGTMALGSGAFEGPYTFESRFEEGDDTNPEELIGAALAGCFSMALALALAEAGHQPETISTDAQVSLRASDDGPSIAGIRLTTRGRVAGIDEPGFRQAAEETGQGCIVARALAVPIEVEATLES